MQCAKDCDPYNRVWDYRRSCVSHNPWQMLVFAQLKPYFNICALFFFNFYMQRIKFTFETCKQISVSIFLL